MGDIKKGLKAQKCEIKLAILFRIHKISFVLKLRDRKNDETKHSTTPKGHYRALKSRGRSEC